MSAESIGVAVSEELFAEVQPGIRICYQTFGDPSGEPLLLVMGLGGPMTWWNPELCVMLAERGFFVVRFDNRDIGRSSRMTGRVTMPQIIAAYFGFRVDAPYSIADLAADGFGLLDHLGIERAHVYGMSMGGMVAQTMAIERPERVLSLVSMMSTTGSKRVGWQHPVIFPQFLKPSRNEEEYVESAVRMWRLIGSPAYPAGIEETRARARATYRRGIDAGVTRQTMAVLTQPDRTEALGTLRMPVTVIHSLGDKMVDVSGGRATSMAIPGAKLLLVDGMGHDLPHALWDTVARAIRATADRV